MLTIIRKLTRLVLLAAFLSLSSTSCGSSVPAGSMGLRWRPFSSGLSSTPVPRGFYFHLPWNEIIVYSIQWQGHVEKVEVLTRDGTHLTVEASVTVRPIAAELYALHTEIGPEFYTNVVQPQFLTVARSTMGERDMRDIPRRSVELEQTIRRRLAARLRGKHVVIDSVAIRHVDFPPEVARAANEKLAKDQELQQRERDLALARKDAEIARIRAQGAADAALVGARGEAERAKVRAAGEAEAQRLISATLTPRMLQLKALTSEGAKVIYAPVGKGGLPLVLPAQGP